VCGRKAFTGLSAARGRRGLAAAEVLKGVQQFCHCEVPGIGMFIRVARHTRKRWQLHYSYPNVSFSGPVVKKPTFLRSFEYEIQSWKINIASSFSFVNVICVGSWKNWVRLPSPRCGEKERFPSGISWC